MSSNTKNLGLLKKDPGTDGAETFNIKTMMNDNWDKIDAAVPGAEVKDAPAGTDHMFLYDNAAAGKPKKVLLSKLVELWKKTFYTREDTDSLLSKKVAKPIQIPSSADLNDYTAPGFYYVGADAAAVTIKNSPVSHSFALLVEIGANGDPVQTLKTWIDVDQYRATTFVRSKYPNWHGGWIKNATTTPPRAFTLPLAAGWTRHRSCQYFKTQDNVVTVYFQVKADVPKSGETIIATLPVGFRPDDLIGGTGYCVMPDSIYFPADIKVFQDGNITGFNTQGEAQYYTGFFTFVAGA